MEVKQFEIVIHSTLKSLGFRRKGRTFYKENDAIIFLFYLQKSTYSKLFYPCYSLFFKDLEGRVGLPKEHFCHFRTRIPKVWEGILVDTIFDLDENILDEQREKSLISTIKSYILFINNNAKNVELFATFFFQNQNEYDYAISFVAKKYLQTLLEDRLTKPN